MKNLSILALIISLVAAGIVLTRSTQPTAAHVDSTLAHIQATKTVRAAYDTYFPYNTKDPKTGELTGYSVDMINYIAKQNGWKVEWVESSADTMIPDLQSGKYDVMATPIFRTIPRATRVTFTES